MQYFDRSLTSSEIAKIAAAGPNGVCAPTPTPSATPTPSPTPTGTLTPTPTPTPTPTSTCSPVGTVVDGQGTVLGLNDQANFSIALQLSAGRKKTKPVGTFSFGDPGANLSIANAKVKSLSFVKNTAHFYGKIKQAGKKLTFDVDVTDNCDPGTLDIFSIQTSGGYSATGNLTSGNISFTTSSRTQPKEDTTLTGFETYIVTSRSCAISAQICSNQRVNGIRLN